jgi:hypothetical protein
MRLANFTALALLLACNACVGDDLPKRARAEVPRDARGDAVLTAIAPAPGNVPVFTQSCTHRRRCP